MKYIRALRRLLANTDRVNDVLAASERLVQGVEKLVQGVENQATASNERLDRLHRTLENIASDLNRRLDLLIATAINHSASNERLEAIIKAITNQSTAANLRLDRLIAAVHGYTSGGKEPRVGDVLPARGECTRVEERSQNGLNAEWLKAPSPMPRALPLWSEGVLANKEINGSRIRAPANALGQYQPLLDALQPWEGQVPAGYLVDFLGVLTDAHFRTMYGINPSTTGGRHACTEIPLMRGENGEWWFEAINWLVAAREARDGYVMITLGASYGAQAVGAFRALQIVNPLPCKLVAVEPVLENYLWLQKHFRDNGIDPEAHWLINAAISDRNDPVLFPVGGAGSGANNCMSTDLPAERKMLAEELISRGKAADTLRSLMLNNTTGVMRDMLPGQDVTGEIELVSAVTLRDLLSAFDMVDYLETDIQQSEVRVFPPFLDLLRRKVRRVHIGTHGRENHQMLHDLFSKNGWEIVFSYPPNGTYKCELGTFELNDGVLTLRNPDL